MKKYLRKIKKILKRVATISTLNKETFPLLNKKKLTDLMDGHAYIHDDEIALFSKIAKACSGTIVEIGCAFGASSSIFLLHSDENVRLHSIDPFIQDSMRDFQASAEICKKNVSRILQVFKKQTRLKDWSLHTDYSYNVVKNWTESVDVIFIDGDHTYEAVRKDFEDWFPHVKTGGLIMFHDSRKEESTPVKTFNRGWVGPTKFVKELKSSGDVQLIDTAFSVTVWQKR
jgi:predicted O-methyltransferase YrrM